MPEFIPRSEQRPIVDTSSTTLDLIYFDLVTLASNEQDIRRLPAHESLYVVLSGQVDIEVDDIMFEAVGRRADIWGGDADSVYAPVGANVRISARGAAAEVAIAGGLCNTHYAPFRITPDEVDAVNVGSSDTHSQRRIVHLLGQRQNGRCGNLLVSELYAGEGCWSGYPPTNTIPKTAMSRPGTKNSITTASSPRPASAARSPMTKTVRSRSS